MEHRVKEIMRSASAGLTYKRQMQQIRAARAADYAGFKRKAASDGDRTDGNETDPVSDDDNNNNNKRFCVIDVDSDATDPQDESDDEAVVVVVTDDVRTASRALQQAVDMAARAATAAAVAEATAADNVDVNADAAAAAAAADGAVEHLYCKQHGIHDLCHAGAVEHFYCMHHGIHDLCHLAPAGVAAGDDDGKYRYCEYHGVHDVCHAVDFASDSSGDDNDDDDDGKKVFDRADPLYRSNYMSPEDVHTFEQADEDETPIAEYLAECADDVDAMQDKLIDETRCSKRAAAFFCSCVVSMTPTLLPIPARPLARDAIAHISFKKNREDKEARTALVQTIRINNRDRPSTEDMVSYADIVNAGVAQREIDFINTNFKRHPIFSTHLDRFLHVTLRDVPPDFFDQHMRQGIDYLVELGITRTTALLIAHSAASNNPAALPPPLVHTVWDTITAARRKYIANTKARDNLNDIARTLATPPPPPAAPHNPHDPRFAGDDAVESDYDDDLIDPRQ